MNRSRNNIALMSLLIPLLLFQAGCVYLVVGSLGAVGGYVVSPDTVEGVTSYDKNQIWDAAVEVLSIMGLIEEQSEAGGMIIAKVHGAKVTVTIFEINQDTTKLSVKSRKAFLPKISVAQDVYVKIINYLEG